MDEYTVELYRANGTHERQIDIFKTYEEAEQYIDDNPVDENTHYYSIWGIEYDENGEETDSFPMY